MSKNSDQSTRTCFRLLTELWAELRKCVRHELPGLMLTHDVGDLLSALLRTGAVESGQRVLAYDITFGHKVTAGGLVRPVHAARLSEYDGRRQLGRPVDATSGLAEVTAAGQVVEDHAVQSGSRHPSLFGRLQLAA